MKGLLWKKKVTIGLLQNFESFLFMLVYWRVYALGASIYQSDLNSFSGIYRTLSNSYVRDQWCKDSSSYDVVSIRVIPSLTDSLISSFPHITTSLNDTFVGFLFCWVLRVIFWCCVNFTINCCAECCAKYLAGHSECCILWGPAECST